MGVVTECSSLAHRGLLWHLHLQTGTCSPDVALGHTQDCVPLHFPGKH
jgi:hypothetical protein